MPDHPILWMVTRRSAERLYSPAKQFNTVIITPRDFQKEPQTAGCLAQFVRALMVYEPVPGEADVVVVSGNFFQCRHLPPPFEIGPQPRQKVGVKQGVRFLRGSAFACA